MKTFIPAGYRELEDQEKIVGSDIILRRFGANKETAAANTLTDAPYSKIQIWDKCPDQCIVRKVKEAYTRIDKEVVEIPEGYELVQGNIAAGDLYYRKGVGFQGDMSSYWHGKFVETLANSGYDPIIKKKAKEITMKYYNVPAGYRPLKHGEIILKTDTLIDGNKRCPVNNSVGEEYLASAWSANYYLARKIAAEKIAVVCPTIEIYKAVQEIAFRHKVFWIDEDRNLNISGFSKGIIINLCDENGNKRLANCDKGWVEDNNYTVLTLGDVEQIEEFLAVPKEEPLKAGDWAICKEGFTTDDKDGGHGYQVGLVFEIARIEKIDEERGGNIYWPKNEGAGIRSKAARKATLEEIQKANEIRIKNKAVTICGGTVTYDGHVFSNETLKKLKGLMYLNLEGHFISVDQEKKVLKVGCTEVPFNMADKILKKAGV